MHGSMKKKKIYIYILNKNNQYLI